jgi:hypothetical protein
MFLVENVRKRNLFLLNPKFQGEKPQCLNRLGYDMPPSLCKVMYVIKPSEKGRAIAQAVSRRLPTAAARVQTRV